MSIPPPRPYGERENEDARTEKMSDWKKDVPFPRHWLFYLVIKIAILAFAVYLARTHGYI